jgi:hypothetical protein
MPLNVDKISTGSLSVNGTEINKNGGLAYKIYTALLTQSGTNAPVAIVLENTLGGDITWEYDGVGEYSISNLNLPINKTILLTPSIPANSCTVGSAITNLVSMSLHPSGTFIDLCVGNSIGGVNGKLNRHPIEIRVYD